MLLNKILYFVWFFRNRDDSDRDRDRNRDRDSDRASYRDSDRDSDIDSDRDRNSDSFELYQTDLEVLDGYDASKPRFETEAF